MNIVLVGAGLAAQRCAHALRRRGHDGGITIVGDEGRLPYDRPPLSKEHLAGELDDAALALRPAAWYAAQGIELRLADPAVALDPTARVVRTASGERLAYDRVLIATGAAPIALPGLQDAHALRSARDAAGLAAVLRPGARLAVAGAGFVGQEVAATARRLGVDVTLVEAAPAPLHALLGPDLGAWFARLHREEGVDVRLGMTIARHAQDAITLSDGTRVACDAVLCGVGVRPDTRWLGSAGLPPDGLPVDVRGATAVADVFAAGDVALGHHWEAAVAQGVAAAHGMLGLAPPPHPRPSFWSDQYGVRIQFAGDPRGADAIEVDGDPGARDFTALYLRDGCVRAGLLVGRPRALPALRDQLDQPLPERRAA